MTEKQRQWLERLEEKPEKDKGRDTLENVRKFWESVMEDEEINIQHRLKASELCLKLKEEGGEENRVIIISGEDELEG